MKKRILTFSLALMMVLSLTAGLFTNAPAVSADENDLYIKLHYNRPDGVYDGWSVWFWADGKDGADYPFAEENGEMVATYKVSPGDIKIGFIVKLPDWAAKDVNEDQFIEIPEVISGTVHIYVESTVPGYEKVYGDDVITGTKVASAKYERGTGIVVTTTAPVEDPNAFIVLCGETEIALESVTETSSCTYAIKAAEALDLTQSYKLIFDETEYKIVMPNYYSTEEFEEKFTYSGSDLGANWTPDKTTFRLWAPTATAVKVNLYKSGTHGTDDLIEQLEMTADVNGTWIAEKSGNLNGTYYTYQVNVDGGSVEACDPYAKATGVNGKRAMVIDMASTNPEGWENDTDPNAGKNFNDAVIYELHVRDLSIDESSGIQNKGKYLGLIEAGTTTASGLPTGLDHMKNLGITHLHILPMYDYGSVDETRLDKPHFNWGYDPVNYNVPEGSYSSDPYNGAVRVSEVKQMVKGLHDNGISVIMDVVYNHVYSAGEFCFNKIVPNYFSRTSASGSFSNGSGCGNDTASERAMVKKYIVDSVKYWADEYHIDGFRFDLVGLIDTETINAVMEEVHKTHPNVVFYGEGWTMSTTVTKEGYLMTTQVNSTEVPGFAFFSDTIRDALKGTVFDNNATGYVSNTNGFTYTIKECFTGSPSWCKSPTQTINYASCHDNMTLFDRLAMSNPDATKEELVQMNNLAAAIYMTSQGIPFVHAGEEILRTKPLEDGTFEHNSYNSPDSVNSFKWDTLNDELYQTTYNYYKGLIAFRKAHPALRMTDAAEIKAKISAIPDTETNVIAFHIASGANGEANELVVIFNPRKEATSVTLPEGNWNVYISGDKAGTEVLGSAEATVSVDAVSAMVLVKEAPAANTDGAKNSKIVPAIIAGAAALGAAAVGAAIILKKRKK